MGLTRYLVVLRWFDSEEDEYLGPFQTKAGAAEVRERLDRNIRALDGGDTCAVYVEPVDSGRVYMDFRERLLAGLRERGYSR